MKHFKKSWIVVVLLLLAKMNFAQINGVPQTRINDYSIDATNNKIYIGGKFTEFHGVLRNNLIALDGSTGNPLKWDPKIGANQIVNALVYDKDEIFSCGVATDNTGKTGFLYVHDSSGALKRNLTPIFLYLNQVNCMSIINNLLYINGIMEDQDDNQYGTITMEKDGTVITTPQSFNMMSCKKIVGNASKICLLTDDKLHVFSLPSYTLDTVYSFGAFGKASDCVIDGDEVFVSGTFYWDGGPQGGMKFNLKNKTQVDWEFSYLDSTCYVKPTTDLSCISPPQYGVSTISTYGNNVYVGGKIASRSAGNCVADNMPRQLDKKTSFPMTVTAIKKLFLNYGSSIRSIKIANDKLYYVTLSNQFCSNGYGYTDYLAAYCLAPSPPGEITGPVTFPCIGKDYVFEVKELMPNRKYVWACDLTGTKITQNGNKATISFPYFKLETNITVRVVDECGQQSNPVSFTLFHSVANPTAYVSGEDKTLTCTRTSFPMKATANESPVNYTWTYPDGSQSTTQEINVTKPGIYSLDLLNTNSGCTSSQNVTVGLDTAKPVIKNPLTYTFTSCPFSVKAIGESDSTSDVIKWYDNTNTEYSNPAVFTSPGTYIEQVLREKTGCVTKAIIKVNTTTPIPSIIPPSTAVKDANGNVVIDTLTCINKGVLMNFTSNVSNYKIDIKRPSPFNDVVPNNSTVNASGFYTINVQDLTTSCNGNPILVEVKSDFSKPQLVLPATIPTINCSFSTAVLDGKSATPGAQLVWTGSGGFSSSNPATVNKPGEYLLTVTDPHNGCTKIDTVEIIKANTLALKGQKDTIICIGSEIELTTKPVGGSPSFTYAWSSVAGNNASIKVKPVTTTSYSVTVIDAANCVGKDTIVVKVPAAIRDSTITFAPCDPASINGQIQIFASGGIPPYMYSNDKGITYQNSQIFSNLAFGTYQLSVKDSLGCTHDFSKSIDAQSQKPTSDFIINTNMMAKDTFVVVDISNPRPDTIIWKFPASVKVINTNFYAPIIVSNDTGEVNVIMETHFGTCVNNLTKKVKFIKKDTTISPTKGNGIEELNIFPNPNTGEFTVEVKLFKKQRLAIYVFDTQGVEQIRVVEPIVDYSINNIVLPVKTPGTYILKVIAEYDSKAKGIIVTQ